MELTLIEEEGIHILQVAGEIDLKALSIVKAGLSKLLKTGKDQIVIDLSSVSSVPSDFVDTVLGIDRVARELGGQISICGLDKTIRAGLGTELNAIQNYETREKALANMQLQTEAGEELPENVVRLLSAKDTEIHALKERLKMNDPEEARKLRKEVEFLRDLNSKLEVRVAEQMKLLRLPTNDDAVKAKIKEMEDNLRNFVASE